MLERYEEIMTETLTNKTTEIIGRYDNLQNNPDSSLLREIVSRQLSETGMVNMALFACPKYNTQALLTDRPENYFESEAKTPDLFTPRVKRLNEMINDLKKEGIMPEITIFIGDSDYEDYLKKFFEIEIDTTKAEERRSLYLASFEKRANELLNCPVTAMSISDLGSNEDNAEPSILREQLESEIKFLNWLFSENGPYKGLFKFSEEELTEIAKEKFKSYAKQGEIIEQLGSGILLQTETPWLLRTQMLKSGGARFATIYPWIRQEDIIS